MKLLRFPSPASQLELRTPEELEFNEEYSPWAIYRNHTVVLLRKYFRMSLEVGRMPSLLGGELFRAKVTAYQVHTFEDSVIFVHDMEQCLARLDALSRILIGKIVLQDFSRDEIAREMRVHERHIRRKLLEGLDTLSEILLQVRLLDPFCESDGLPIKKGPVSVAQIDSQPERAKLDC